MTATRETTILRAWLAAMLVFSLTWLEPGRAAGFSESSAPALDYGKDVKPVLSQYCYGCHNEEKHKGGLSLKAYPDLKAVLEHRDRWGEVLHKLREGTMPPEGKPQPPPTQRQRIAGWLEDLLFPVDCSHPDPGRVTLRRLNRAEYNNTIHDLLGIDFQPADDFPADDTGYGFDNVGDVLTVSPLLVEKYLAAAEKILDAAMAEPRSRERLVAGQPEGGNPNPWLRRNINRFADHAFRRPTTGAEQERLFNLAEQTLRDGATPEESFKTALEAALVSPHFLFRGELQPEPDNPRVVRTIDEYALASRLSYFLWSSMPDDELFVLAGQGRLRSNLEAQVRRMVADPKSHALVDNFAGQWLQTRALKEAAPDPETFPAFDAELRTAMAQETEMFFSELLHQDRSILEFLTADYTFVNERLARHYGLRGVTGPEFRRVSLKGTGRAGVLTHAGILTVTSNPTRTSPVKRGKWVLENLLAQPPPPPPPGVPPLGESKEDSASATLRQRMERHRQDPMCASCHAQMDPIGFSLEHFDGVGAWRDKDGTLALDVSGQLPSGEHFSGATQLLQMLARQKREAFAKCLVEKMLTYALGRGLEYYDRCAVERIVSDLPHHGYRFSTLILGVVKSAPFQMRRGDGQPETLSTNEH